HRASPRTMAPASVATSAEERTQQRRRECLLAEVAGTGDRHQAREAAPIQASADRRVQDQPVYEVGVLCTSSSAIEPTIPWPSTILGHGCSATMPARTVA